MTIPDTDRCPNCFAAAAGTPCPQCGWQPGLNNPPPALTLGTLLDGRYRIGRVLGHGGFGITYLAWDDNLHLRLAIKEYLPRDCSSRAPDGISLAVYSGPAAGQFTYGLDRFLEEARTLAHFDQHPGIVTVKNFFRAHGTGYCVMDYVEGITLRQYLDQQPGGRIGIEAALKLLMPVADALRAVHKEGLLHRDIAPDNIYVTQDGRIKLLDFGAARFAASEHSKSLSIILKPGYAPEEQYRTRGKQGPWTDVYGLGATLYRAITGNVPPESLDRLDHDDLPPPSKLGIAITPGQEAALLQALAVKAGQRFQGMAELQQAWRSGAQLPPQSPVDQGGRARASGVVAQPATTPIKGRTGIILASVVGLALFALIGFWLWPTGLAAVGNARAQNKLGWMYSMGEGVTENKVEAVRWFRKAAEQGHAPGQVNLGVSYAKGEGISQDDAEAVRWLRSAAEQGDAEGQYNLGVMYANGQGVVQDEAEAVRWYRNAAEQGHAEAQFYLGVMYANGQGVAKNEAEAVRWYRKAAEQGLAEAQFNLGVAYANGRGVTQDEAEAVRWFRKAAEQGLAEAQSNLGVMYEDGRGVTQDAAEAVRWYRKGAEQGNAIGQDNLGLMYANGLGVTQDAAEAVRWYRKAADQGLALGQVHLGAAYANGQGVAKDKAEAVRWYRKAADQGDADAQAALKALGAKRK